jgi:hypothetical protein
MVHSTTNRSRDDAGTVLSAVADDHRRAVLRSLHDTEGGKMDLEVLTEEVADRLEKDALSEDEHRQRILIALHHNHLPKLDAAEMVVYTAERKSVRTTAGELGTKLLDTVGPYDSTRK